MNIIKIIFLGIVQGVTEFLPISSSGHLVIFQNLLGINNNQLTLNIFLHFGTVIPIIIIYWDDVRDILLFKKGKRHLTYLILIGIIPTGLIGLFFQNFIESLFASILSVGYMLLITGLLIYLSECFSNTRININNMKTHNAIIVGIVQGLAVIPGISRSGSTIVSSLFQGLDREAAARYSLLISIPVITGAGLMEIKAALTVGLNGTTWSLLLIGGAAAAISGFFAIKYLLHVLREGSLIIFSYYCWIMGILIITLAGVL